MSNPYNADDGSPDNNGDSRSADHDRYPTGNPGPYPDGYQQPYQQPYQAYPNTAFPPVGYPVVSPYPGAGARLGALILDLLIVTVVTSVIGFFLLRDDISTWIDQLNAWDPDSTAAVPELDMSDFYIISFLSLALWLIYRMGMEVALGQTVGKMALKMKVVDIDGRTPTAGAAFIRNSWYLIMAVAGLIPVLGAFASLIMYIALGVTISRDTYRQSFTDKWAKTYVVSTR